MRPHTLPTQADRDRWHRLPWVGLAVVTTALLAMTLLWGKARREADALAGWQAAMLRQIGRAAPRPGAPPAPADAADALARIVATRDAELAMASAVPPPDAIAAPDASGPDTGGEISRLRATQSTGTAAGDAQIIERDSRAAWTGWQ